MPGDRARDGGVASLSVGANVTLPVLGRYARRHRLGRREMDRDAAALLARHDVRPADPAILLGSLSGGNQQKALLAKWIDAGPRLLLLDEPTRGVDVGARTRIAATLAALARDGVATLCASSDHHELALLCHRVLVFGDGTVYSELAGVRADPGADRRAQPGRRARRAEHPPMTAAQRLALPAAWLGLIVLFGLIEPDTFLTSANVQNILGSQAVLVVLTMGLLIPLTAGDYDLSIASVLTLSSMIVALLNAQQGWPVGLAIVVAVAAGALAGLANGALVVLLRADPLVITLGSGTLIAGIVLWISNSETIGGVSSALVDPVNSWKLLGLPLAFYYGLALCAAVWYLLDFTPNGRRLLFVGRSRRVARLAGVRVDRARAGAFVASGTIAAVAGVLYAGTTGGADPSSGASFLLPAFAAAFLGATSIFPGRFNPWGSIVAVYFLVTGVTGLQLLGAASFVQQLFYGGGLILAVAVSRLTGSGMPGADET